MNNIKYDNSSIRRQDRLLAEEDAIVLLKNGEYGVLSLITPEGFPYALPINFVWNNNNSIYLHCAPEGRKLNCIKHNDSGCFTIVGSTNVISRKFTTSYSSIVIQVKAVINLSKDEKMDALKLFISKYSPNDVELGLKYTEKSFHRTEIIRLDILEMSGKSKVVQ
ncbi:MAG: pyridoxamine 5'-phosphate oxidase family protein [Bacteroidales bacterium]|nr:pyridoxamine 5'-phosphate oxidase family protein [Bacteroidales bacterium]